MKKPYKIYAENPEPSAMEQFMDAMAQPWVTRGALMADAHTGYSLPIGGVVATKDVVVASYVGFDIGCGVCALPLDSDPDEIIKNADEIFNKIYEKIPVGRNWNKKRVSFEVTRDLEKLPLTSDMKKDYNDRGVYQIGSLGSGNHFIEIGKGEDEQVWIIIHSGSRNFGHTIATKYMRLASPNNKASEGHYPLYTNTLEGAQYVQDLKYALEFALLNRLEMLRRVEKILPGNADWNQLINRNHNHAEFDPTTLEWIHRKGATHAEKDMMGVIPGNMRDGSFIVRGLGNPDSLNSSSHGAGRVMGRRKAKENLDLQDFIDEMVDVVAKVDLSTLDESPEAYKDIFEVMELQRDLVEVITRVSPIINVKG